MTVESFSSPFTDPLPAPEALLEWYLAAGVDEAIADQPQDRYQQTARQASQAMAASPMTERAPTNRAPADRTLADRTLADRALTARSAPSALSPPRPMTSRRPEPTELTALPSQAKVAAGQAARACQTLEELRTSVEAFDGCALKVTATNTVFGDGNPQAPLLIVGEAPGREEDRQGIPFVGESGKLLSRMLESIGLDRTGYYITNILPWRPPGNRTPTDQEVAVCLPFVLRHIALIDPKVILLLGGLSARSLFARPEGIMRQRGIWRTVSVPDLDRSIPTLATLHPAYLLRQPTQKRLAWRDLLEIQDKLRAEGELLP